MVVMRDGKDGIQAMLWQCQHQLHQLWEEMFLEKGIERIRVRRHYAGKRQVWQPTLRKGDGEDECSLEHVIERQPRHQPFQGTLKELHGPQHRPCR